MYLAPRNRDVPPLQLAKLGSIRERGAGAPVQRPQLRIGQPTVPPPSVSISSNSARSSLSLALIGACSGSGSASAIAGGVRLLRQSPGSGSALSPRPPQRLRR